jgi:hypothetical protein
MATCAYAQSGWQAIRNSNGEIKATIELATIMHDRDGNAHARVCLIEDGRCKIPVPWFFNCSDHSYSLDLPSLSAFPHEMIRAGTGSIADQLATVACK